MRTRVDGNIGAHGFFLLYIRGTKIIQRLFLLRSVRQDRDKGWMDNVNVVNERLGFVFSWCDEFHSNKPCAFRATRRPRYLRFLYLEGSFTKQKSIFGKG